jgi:Hsp70 protein
VGYHLGLDVGSTFTTAAVERDGRVETLPLGIRTSSVPSVVFVDDDGELHVDDVLRWAYDQACGRYGEPPAAIAVSHPANRGPYERNLLAPVLRHAGLARSPALPAPVAVAAWYASQVPLRPGAVVVVYDLGGGTVDAAIVRYEGTSFEILGTPDELDRLDRLGGAGFDEAVLGHVARHGGVTKARDRFDGDDPAGAAALLRLRHDSIVAKEGLSSDTEAAIPMGLGARLGTVRLTRGELEVTIPPAVPDTVDSAVDRPRLRRRLQLVAGTLVASTTMAAALAAFATFSGGEPDSANRPDDAATATTDGTGAATEALGGSGGTEVQVATTTSRPASPTTTALVATPTGPGTHTLRLRSGEVGQTPDGRILVGIGAAGTTQGASLLVTTPTATCTTDRLASGDALVVTERTGQWARFVVLGVTTGETDRPDGFPDIFVDVQILQGEGEPPQAVVTCP